MIHASKLFPIAMDRIRDQIERGHATQTAKARALLDAFDEGEKRGKRSVRNAADRGAIRVKRKEKRARARQLTLNLK
tara:strand:+ start:240 stop:470 length:231 start_codon:yes stop_codon:yes gene_type:complete